MAASVFRELHESVEGALRALGAYTLFAGRLAVETPRALLRFRLVVEQVHNAGALSLVIIMMSGCSSAWSRPAGFRPARALRFRGIARHGRGARPAEGTRPGHHGPAVCGPGGTALASELGLMRATDQLAAIEMMAVDRCGASSCRASSRHHLDAAAAAIFSMIGLYGAQLVGYS